MGLTEAEARKLLDPARWTRPGIVDAPSMKRDGE